MSQRFNRTAALLGEAAVTKLSKSRVLICGIGGVGSFAAEAIARCGVGYITLVDCDVIEITNINRQIHATVDTVGLFKTDVMRERIKSINPDCCVTAINIKISESTLSRLNLSEQDYVIDAIDSVDAKVALITECKSLGVDIISSMGAANKIMPGMFEIADIYKTSVDPLARVMRKKLKEAGISDLKVCFSREQPLKTAENTLGSVCFTTAACGLMIAGEIVKNIIY